MVSFNLSINLGESWFSSLPKPNWPAYPKPKLYTWFAILILTTIYYYYYYSSIGICINQDCEMLECVCCVNNLIYRYSTLLGVSHFGLVWGVFRCFTPHLCFLLSWQWHNNNNNNMKKDDWLLIIHQEVPLLLRCVVFFAPRSSFSSPGLEWDWWWRKCGAIDRFHCPLDLPEMW